MNLLTVDVRRGPQDRVGLLFGVNSTVSQLLLESLLR
jgi:hypothetical protein